MTKQQKYYAIGAAVLALISFFGFKAMAAKKAAPSQPKKTTSLEIGDVVGEFTSPALVLSKLGTRLRQQASTASNIIKTYQQAAVKLIVLGESEQADGLWYKVKDELGNLGWVRADVVSSEAKVSFDAVQQDGIMPQFGKPLIIEN
jgi:uncharacterized protein YgiM (DUF1202 family)